MPKDARRQRELIAELHLESVFNSAHLGFTKAEEARFPRATAAENERAVLKIRAWRKYLPEPCVCRMIDDGWQWST
jgi:hypothetical protein